MVLCNGKYGSSQVISNTKQHLEGCKTFNSLLKYTSNCTVFVKSLKVNKHYLSVKCLLFCNIVVKETTL